MSDSNINEINSNPIADTHPDTQAQIQAKSKSKSKSKANEPIIDYDQLLNQIQSYFKGPLLNEDYNDISYKSWVIPNQNIKFLCNEIIVNFENVFQVLYYHDIKCEMKLIKWITEDKVHLDNVIKESEGLILNPHEHTEAFPYFFNSIIIDQDKKTSYNASYINGPLSSLKHMFIAAQSPTKDTVESYWKMLMLNSSINLIISLISSDEKDKGDIWRGHKSALFDYKDITITKVSETLIEETCLYQRQYELLDKKSNSKRVFSQLVAVDLPLTLETPQYTLTIKSIRVLLKAIEKESFGTVALPRVLMDCNNIVNKTGVIIALFNIAKCLKVQNENNTEYLYINVFNPIRKLREQKINLIENEAQYKFIYDYCMTMLKEYFN